ncbi:septin-5-like [Scleropages formosus]|uniref:Septin-7 n=1 Tax=Scleropages formosus TaxID=113540 RepID=A0A0P7U595_SCLFO|nr:septin-5-like [Scleropages formosus]
MGERINQTVEIIKHTVDIEEKGVKLKLTIVDTPGFGDAVNNNECWKPITDYIDQQFEQYFRDESGLNRKNIQDNRVHCCLYFIPPFGHGLRPVDVEFMKALHEKVNVVPLIAKADCLMPVEVKKLKDRIREEIDKFGIKVYQFPDCDSDEDDEFKQQDKELKESTPFAVIGSNTVVEAKGQRVRGRLYPWGIVEVENQSHCDFVKLRNMLIRTHMHDLKDVTCDVHYENYRAQCIQQMTSKLTQENRMDSPIPILPLPTPDVETEKLIKMKDEELHDNQLSSLPNGLLDGLPALRTVTLHGNPWVCDCGLLYLRSWLLKQEDRSLYRNITCSSPPGLQGRLVMYLVEEEVLQSCRYWYCNLALASQVSLMVFIVMQAILLLFLILFLRRFEKLSQEARHTAEESLTGRETGSDNEFVPLKERTE